MENKKYTLNNIHFLCSIDKTGNIEIVPFVYNASKTAVKNLKTNKAGEIGTTYKFLDFNIAKALGVDFLFCETLTSFKICEEIIEETPRIKLFKELKDCTYWHDFSYEIDYDKLRSFVNNTQFSDEKLDEYIKRFAKVYKKENKDYIKDVKQYPQENREC